MMTKVHFLHDRPKGKNRRIHFDQDYFLKGGIENRSGWERRTIEEGGRNRIKVVKGTSVGLPYSDYPAFSITRFGCRRSI